MTSRYDFRILGQLEARIDDRSLDLTAGQQTLLAHLLVRANEVVTRAELSEALWPDDEPGAAARRLSGQITGLRRKLETGSGDADRGLAAREGGYALLVSPNELDLLRFRSLAATGRSALAAGDASRAAEALEDALALWHGPALRTVDGGPALDEAAQRIEALRAMTAADLSRARRAIAAAEADRQAEREEIAPAPIELTGVPAPAGTGQAFPERVVAVAATLSLSVLLVGLTFLFTR